MNTEASSAQPIGPIGRVEIPLAGLVSAAAFLSLFVIPLVGVLGVPLCAVPLVRIAHRRGVAAGLIGCALCAAAVLGVGWAAAGAGEGFTVALIAAAVTALPTATVGFLRAAVDPSRCYLGLCLAGGALLAAASLTPPQGATPTLATQVAAGFDRLIPATVDAYAHAGASPEMVVGMRSMLEAVREFFRFYLWGVFGALWVLSAAIAFYMGARVARPAPSAEAVRFEQLRVPAAAAGLFVATGAAFGLASGIGRRIAGNLMLPLLALFFATGLSIICHFFRRWFRSRILRAGLYTALAAYLPVSAGVALLGLFDWYVDFRRRGGGAKGT